MIYKHSVTVDVVIFTIERGLLSTLLIHRVAAPFKNNWALPGGFLRKGETAANAAARILKQKAGVSHVYLEQLFTFDEPGRDPRGAVITVAYFALVPQDAMTYKPSKDAQQPAFFRLSHLPKLAFDHRNIVRYAMKRLQAKLEYTNVVYSFLPKHFTFGELQKTYEIILGRGLDKRNFRKKFLSLGLIRKTKHVLAGKRQRPASLYEFVSREHAELKKFF